MLTLTRKILAKKSEIYGLLQARPVRESEMDRDALKEYLACIFVDVGLDDRKLADALGYNITSIRRWIHGDTCPHRALWPQILDWIDRDISRAAEELKMRLDREDARQPAAIVPFPTRKIGSRGLEPAQLPDEMAASAPGDCDLRFGGSCLLEITDTAKSRQAQLRLRRDEDSLMVRLENDTAGPFVRPTAKAKEAVALVPGQWTKTSAPVSWQMSSDVIQGMFFWADPDLGQA